MSNFRILAIDGGGIRGVYTAVLLNRIAQQLPDIFDETHFFAGSSTGSILSVGLAFGIPAAELVEIFRAYGQMVLKKNLAQKLGQVVNAKYDIVTLRKLLTPYFGAAVFFDLFNSKRKNILVPAFDLDGRVGEIRTWKPKIFHNFPGAGNDDGEMVVDVITRSCALPVDFASFQGYIDGTVVANNPSMLALAQALDGDSGKQSLADIRMLSLSTGYFPRFIGGTEHDWGLGKWSWLMVPLMIDSQNGISDYQCQRLLGPNRYHRLAPLLPEPVGLDEAEKTEQLLEFAEEVDLDPTLEWIEKRFLA